MQITEQMKQAIQRACDIEEAARDEADELFCWQEQRGVDLTTASVGLMLAAAMLIGQAPNQAMLGRLVQHFTNVFVVYAQQSFDLQQTTALGSTQEEVKLATRQ